MQHTLEKHKLFPYIAWTTVIIFAIFTYTLTARLTEATKSLGAETQNTVTVLKNTH